MVPLQAPTEHPFDQFDRASLAAALLQVEGLGRVAAGRLLRYFSDLRSLRNAPREQVIVRLKSIPNAAALVAKLHDDAIMVPIAETVQARRLALQRRRVSVTCRGDDTWPEQLDALAERDRPLLLYHFGSSLDVLRRSVTMLAATPIAHADDFELAQSLVIHLSEAAIPITTAARDGFDVVMHKRASDVQPTPPGGAMVLPCGLSRMDPKLRPTATQLVRRGGVLVSAFDMDHGPFAHDDHGRALQQAALSPVCVFVDPAPASAEEMAMTWALEHNRSVFVIGARGAGASGAHPVAASVDFDWVVAAVTQAKSPSAAE